MSEAINNSRVHKNMPADELLHDADSAFYKALTKRATALLRLNGFNRNDRWGYDGTMRVWAITNEFGLFCMAIGSCEQEALDNAVDNDCLDTYLINDTDIEVDADIEGYAYLGNASEAFDLTYINMFEVK